MSIEVPRLRLPRPLPLSRAALLLTATVLVLLLSACGDDAEEAIAEAIGESPVHEPAIPAGPPPAGVEPPPAVVEAPPVVEAPAPPIEPPTGEGAIDWESRRRDLLIPLTDAADLAIIDELGAVVAERRGLALAEEVPVYLIRRDDLADYALSLFDDEDLEDADFAEALFRLFGIIDDQDFVTLQQELYVGLVLGFYDPEVDSFVIVSGNDHIADRDIPTIAHEYVHVVQDQHYDLEAAFDALDDNSDKAEALRFLVEGDARTSEALFFDVAARLAAQLESAGDRIPGLSTSIPAALERIFIAPYQEGTTAVARLLNEGGQQAIDDLLANPPDSTEQMLHLDKLAAREQPLIVPAPDVAAALGADWTLLGHDTLGEFIIGVILNEELDRSVSTAAAAGWGGDRLSLYRDRDGDTLAVWRLRWDSARDAFEFFAAVRDWLNLQSNNATLHSPDGTTITWNGERVSYWLHGAGTETWIVAATQSDDLTRALPAVLPG